MKVLLYSWSILLLWHLGTACNSSTGEATETPRATVEETDASLTVRIGERSVLVYHKATVEPPHDTLPKYYRRSAFIHPVYSPDGQVVSDGMPVGHVHQHGVFFAWTNTTYRGVKTDFWNQQSETGIVRHKAVKELANNRYDATFVVTHEHLSTHEGDTTLVLEEDWLVKVHNQADPFIIDITTRQKNVSADTLHINEYHYGGMAFRGSGQWNDRDPSYADSMQVLTDGGLTRNEANHAHPQWVAAYGRINDRYAGVAMRGHADNFRSPEAIRVHPIMPYFCFAPMVDSAFFIAPSEMFEATYRLVVYDGTLEDNRALVESSLVF